PRVVPTRSRRLRTDRRDGDPRSGRSVVRRRRGVPRRRLCRGRTRRPDRSARSRAHEGVWRLTMIRITITSLWARKRRLTGMSVAVALGVAFLTGTLVLGDTLSANFRNLFIDVSANTDVVVRNATVVKAGGAPDSNRGLIDESIIDTVRAVDGVADVEGQVVGYGSLYGR